ncbi:MAG: glycosyltransferase [Vicinamibacteria bacterium]
MTTRPSGSRLLVVLGMMGRCPFGGQTWLYLNWLRGLASLGHDVYYVEDDATWPYDPRVNSMTNDPSYAVAYLGGLMRRIGLEGKWAYRALYRDPAECFGLSREKLVQLYRDCDALLNVCGSTVLNEDHFLARRRIYVETDPVTNQLELANGKEKTRAALLAHDTIVTYGENYGEADCGVPLGGFRYLKTRQPVDLGLWPMAFDAAAPSYTTIGNWRQKGNDIEWRGETYFWSKHHEFLKFIGLPKLRPAVSFDLCLNVDDEADRNLLLGSGFRLSSPLQMSLDPWGYQEFFRGSRAEWTVAKDQNVRLRSGWFSERDACYLASGKPVIAQSTGFERFLPSGEGLFAFRSMDEILAAVDAIESDYPKACRAARAVAQEKLEAGSVCRRFIEDIGL